jgi:valyl-tRNA synthetase
MEKELANVDKQLQRIDGMLSNPGFTGKAPAAVVERERAKQAELKARRSQLAERLADLIEG